MSITMDTTEDDNLRIILCPTCGSEGFIERGHPNNPYPESVEQCPECEGACEVLVEVLPIDLDDLEEMGGPL